MKIYKVKVNGKTYRVELDSVEEIKSKDEEKKVEEKKVEEKKEVVSSSSSKQILAPLQGNVTDVKVKVGDTVKKGQPLCIIEAMKVMNEIESPYDGVIKEIKVQNEEAVGFDQILMVIE